MKTGIVIWACDSYFMATSGLIANGNVMIDENMI